MRRRIGMALQAARALGQPIGNLYSQFEPSQLVAVHQGHWELYQRLLARHAAGDPHAANDIKYLALCYRRHGGHEPAWLPTDYEEPIE